MATATGEVETLSEGGGVDGDRLFRESLDALVRGSSGADGRGRRDSALLEGLTRHSREADIIRMALRPSTASRRDAAAQEEESYGDLGESDEIGGSSAGAVQMLASSDGAKVKGLIDQKIKAADKSGDGSLDIDECAPRGV